ncbi:MAG: hypothetical protein HY646_01750 [Acidobacteria bacterium]|nr:hypothetical protein [Acidobacteriota bacterium]
MSAVLTQIRALLPAIVTQTSWDHAADEDRFEGYVFALVLEAARKEGASIRLENRNGPFNGIATFRTAPGHIWSPLHPYTHAVIDFANKPLLEAHVGVYISGRSRLYHEADVAVLSRAVARTCRADRVDPSQSDAVLLLECKYYASDPGVGLGREFLGLSAECGKDQCVFVTNQSASRLQKLFEAHDREWGHQVLPGNNHDVDRLVGFAQRAFARYKAK